MQFQITCNQADHQNQQIIGFCIDSSCTKYRSYCNSCIPSHSEHLHKLTSLEFLYQWIEQGILSIDSVQKNVQKFKVALDSLISQFLPYFNLNIQEFSQLGVSEIEKLINDLCKIKDSEKVLFIQLNQLFDQGQSIINEILKKIKNQTNFTQHINLQIQHLNQDKLNLEKQNDPFILQPNPKSNTYVLMNQNSIKFDGYCQAIAFDKDCSTVALGCNKLIKIYEFKQEMLTLIQILDEHKDYIWTLNFMKKTNQFLSGDRIGLILIWSRNNNNQWNCSQTIKEHTDSIRCLILNNNEDILISSSNDNKIKFWIKKDEWICQQTISDHEKTVDQLSLNEQENQVISCGRDKQILVIEYSEQNQKWVVIQNIQINSDGYRICFINNNQFTFQPNQGNLMHLYEMNSISQQFTKTKDIAVNLGYDRFGLFPQQFIKQKQLLVGKHHQCVNLIRKTENDEFKVEQSIQFDSYGLYGQMSDDGEYLITWDYSSKLIQIRKYKEG
ncbi:unnamed protein product [Paramecium pentaurelia]|uniref:Uncharacterized protein n=1 Tax=Paramecium pentaurelia TaxID=43138 RepID=A0A8S1YFH4_9CILI|nr:unnamed protein product [Paramecium pentaurelia]